MASELLSNLLWREEGVGDDICAVRGDSLYTGNQEAAGGYMLAQPTLLNQSENLIW